MRAIDWLQALAVVAGIGASLADDGPEYQTARPADELAYGRSEYAASCATCHGDDGRGEGELAEQLRPKPVDLTGLAAANGGEFPYWRVFAIIDGRYVVPGHGTREMPIWGREFLPGDVAARGPKGGEKETEARIHALAAYIATLQRTP